MKKEESKYIKWLISQDMLPSKFLFGVVQNYIMSDDENFDPSRVKEGDTAYADGEMLTRYELGFNAHTDSNLKVKSVSTRSVLFTADVLNIHSEFRVFCPMNVSPDEFFHRVDYALGQQYYNLKSGDSGFDKFKDEYAKQKSNLFKGLKTLASEK